MIYLIENPTAGACKIGVSVNPEARLIELQTGSPHPLVLQATMPGSFAEEKQLHQRFASHRLNGEWFESSAEILEFFGVQRHFLIGPTFALALHKLDGASVKLALWLGINAGYNTNRFTVTPELKRKAAAETGVQAIDNALTQLRASDFVRRAKRGEYIINPDMTWRGDLKSRAKSIQIFLNYTVETP